MILLFVVACRNETLCSFQFFLTKSEQQFLDFSVILLLSIKSRKKFPSCVWSIANIPEFFKRDGAAGIHPIEGFLELPL